MAERTIAAKVPEELFLKLKAHLAAHDITVRQWVENMAASEVGEAEYQKHLEGKLDADFVDANGENAGLAAMILNRFQQQETPDA